MLQIFNCNKPFRFGVVLLISGLTLFSCNITKNLKENEKLLVKNKLKIDYEEIDKKDPGFQTYEIEDIIKPIPNKKFIHPWRLSIYNTIDKENTERKVWNRNARCEKRKQKKIDKLSGRLKDVENEMNSFPSNSNKYKKLYDKYLNLEKKRISRQDKECDKKTFAQKNGEAPALYRFNDQLVSKRKIRVFLKNKGYFTPIVRVEEKKRPGNEKKIILTYTVIPGKPHTISKIIYSIQDKEIKRLVLNDTSKRILQVGKRIDTKLFDNERKRISDYLKTQGYYNFSKEYIYFSIDTIAKKHGSHITIKINNPGNISDSLYHKKHQINNIYIYPNFNPGEALSNKESYFLNSDTLIFYAKDNLKYNLIYKEIPRINPKSIIKGVYIKPQTLYNSNDISSTYKYLASLQIIQIANINFRESSQNYGNDSLEYLDCEIRLSQDDLMANTLSGEMTNTEGNLGIAFNNSFEHLNIFRNTEVFNLKVNFALKRITQSQSYNIEEVQDSLGFFNSQEIGFDLGFKFPRLLAPLPLKRFIKRSNPKTLINMKYNYLREPGFTTSVAGLSFGYNWYSSNTVNHAFTPITGDFVNLIDPAVSFLAWLEENNLEETYDNHFIFGSSYKFTYNNQFTTEKRNHFYFTYYTKLAGNSLNLLMSMRNTQTEDASYSVGGITFAQFYKNEIDFRYYRILNTDNDKLVFRFFAGLAYPYGNLDVVPFTEQYFSGGANGIRAWQERSLGPGSYNIITSEDSATVQLYPNQRSDFKLESNLEYRAKLFWYIESALFVDAGNIWAINKVETNQEVIFDINKFYKQIAVGGGFGLRFDFEFIVFRLDFARKIFDPKKAENSRFVIAPDRGDRLFGNWAINIGIGYPF